MNVKMTVLLNQFLLWIDRFCPIILYLMNLIHHSRASELFLQNVCCILLSCLQKSAFPGLTQQAPFSAALMQMIGRAVKAALSWGGSGCGPFWCHMFDQRIWVIVLNQTPFSSSSFCAFLYTHYKQLQCAVYSKCMWICENKLKHPFIFP